MFKDATPLQAWGPPRQPLRDLAERTVTDLLASTTHTILSGTLKRNAIVDQKHILRFRIAGQASHATSGTVTPTLVIGSTTVLTGAAFTVGSSETPFILEGEFGIVTVGASGEIVGTMECRQNNSQGSLSAIGFADDKAFDTKDDDNLVYVKLTTAAGVTLEILAGKLELLVG